MVELDGRVVEKGSKMFTLSHGAATVMRVTETQIVLETQSGVAVLLGLDGKAFASGSRLLYWSAPVITPPIPSTITKWQWLFKRKNQTTWDLTPTPLTKAEADTTLGGNASVATYARLDSTRVEV